MGVKLGPRCTGPKAMTVQAFRVSKNRLLIIYKVLNDIIAPEYIKDVLT